MLKIVLKYLLPLIILLAVFNALWFVILISFKPQLNILSFPALSLLFFISSSIAIIIFLIGRQSNPKNETFYSFVSICLKFLIELIIAIIWFFIMKKTSTTNILLFFLLYLAFSIISIFIILKLLNMKSL